MQYLIGASHKLQWRRVICLIPVLFLLFASRAYSVGMVATLDYHGRTIEIFQPQTHEIGLCFTDTSGIPLLKYPSKGPRSEVVINYYTGYAQIRSYYNDQPVSAPLAMDIVTFNRERNEARVIDRWRKNLTLSLTKAQFQKHGSGLSWEIVKVPKSVRAILGEGGVGLKVNGYRKILFSGTSRWQGGVQNTGTFRQSKFPSLDMKQTSRFTIKGNIGSKIFVSVDQDSKRESDLSNRIQIRYKGDEDDILQSVELGNTTLNLPNSRFVGYSQRIQGLFGIKSTAKLGNIDLTVIASQEKGNTEKTRFTAGATENVVTIRDYSYLQRTYYDVGKIGPDSLGLGFDMATDSIVDFRLFGVGSSQSAGEDPYANLYIDPNNPEAFSHEFAGSFVREMIDGKDYFLEPGQFWIRLERQHRVNELLACYMKVRTPQGIVEVGNLGNGDTLALKMLKPAKRTHTSETWDYEWKNVYNLGAKRLKYDEFQLDIYKGAAGTERNNANLNHQNGVPYLQLLGLDKFNSAGAEAPDDRVDNVDYLLDLYRGHILFPNHKPFAPDPPVGYAPSAPDSVLDETVPAIYTTSTTKELTEQSKYYIQITTSRRTSTYSLRKINILQNSETVTFNSAKLIRNVDYQIDYELGQITFISDRVLNDPTGDLTIDFEYAPFISAERKTLLGARAEYAAGPGFNIGSTFLYKSQKSSDRKPKLGQETSRDLVGEVDFALVSNPAWMTRLANALPLVETSARSNLRISGEIARSMPNPNTAGYVLVDDFEAIQLLTSLGVLRESWTRASPPTSMTDVPRDTLIWYNPYHDFLVSDVYDRQAKNAQDQRMEVLYLQMQPHETNSWDGIMRALSTGMQDQSRAQYLEIRLGTYGYVEGKLHLDLGEISEDIDGDGSLDTEDRDVYDENGTRIRIKNGILDEGEDTGLDGVFSVDEEGYDAESNPDPHGDDWKYSDDDPFVYDNINGTEGNSKGDRSGYRPDTEDLNNNDFLDQNNNYFSYAIDLGGSPFEVEGSRRVADRHESAAGKKLVFRTYRIPLWSDSEDLENTTGNRDSSLISFARLWVDGLTEMTQIVIAEMHIVENRWRAQPLADDIVADDKRFRAEAINSEENTDYDPGGVVGEENKQSNITEREQSLLLRFENFEEGDTGWAVKILTRAEDYTGYETMRMFVHGDTKSALVGDPPVSSYLFRDSAVVSFIFRMGLDENNYYEQHIRCYPGWDSNSIKFNFDELTPLKQTVAADEFGDRYSGEYKIHGNPTLTQIQYFAVGVTYNEGLYDKFSGEIWCNELQLNNVRNDAGTAARLSLNAQFADFWGFAVNSEYQTYSFRGLTGANSASGSSLLNGSTRTRLSANTSFSIGKLLPAAWRVSIPLTLKYSKDVSEPKLLTGSDIVLTPELLAKETTTNISYGFSSSLKATLPTKHWLAKLTVNAIKFSGSLTRKNLWSPRTTSLSETYNVRSDYSYSNKTLLPISPLAWTRYLFFPKSIWDTRLRLLPKKFTARGELRRTRSTKINNLGYLVPSFTRTFKGQADFSFDPFSVLGGTYGFSTERDLYDPERLQFSFNPRHLKFGQEIKFTQRLGLRYSVPVLRFLSPSLTYNGDYSEDADPKRYRDGSRSGAVSSRLSTGATLNLRKLLGVSKKGRSRRSSSADKRRKREAQRGAPPDSTGPPAREEKKKDSGGFAFKPHAPFVWLLRQVTSPFEPFKGNFSHTENRTNYGLMARPSLLYRLGFTDSLDVARSSGGSSTYNRDSEALTDKYSLNSAINLLGLAKVTTGYDRSKTTNYSTTSTRRAGETFPKLSTSLRNLSNFKPLGWIKPVRWVLDISVIKLDYSHTTNETEKYQTADGDSVLSWLPETKEEADKVGASLRLSQSFRNGLRLTGDYSFSLNRSVKNNFGLGNYLDSRKSSRTIGFSTNYSFRAPNGVRLPFLRNLRLKSTLSLSLAIKYTASLSEKKSKPTDGAYTITDDRSTFTIEPRANYSFSSSMKGGFQMNWQDTKNNQTGQANHVRQVSIWLEFSF